MGTVGGHTRIWGCGTVGPGERKNAAQRIPYCLEQAYEGIVTWVKDEMGGQSRRKREHEGSGQGAPMYRCGKQGTRMPVVREKEGTRISGLGSEHVGIRGKCNRGTKCWGKEVMMDG